VNPIPRLLGALGDALLLLLLGALLAADAVRARVRVRRGAALVTAGISGETP
jgi:hypothetical protein